jgi:hypothetical protein
MEEVKIEVEMVFRALAKAKELGALRNSIKDGEGVVPGFIGEECANVIIGGKIHNTYDYDIVAGNTFWEVKTKLCASVPLGSYEQSVADFNTKQKCDHYCFVRLLHRNGVYLRAFIVGWMPKMEYLRKARFIRKGELDPSNRYVCRADCYNMKICELNSAFSIRGTYGNNAEVS